MTKKVTIIVPSRNEKYLCKTVETLRNNAWNEYEIIVVVDGPTEFSTPCDDKRVRVIYRNKPQGMRSAINLAVHETSSDFIMKIDAHCSVGLAYDFFLAETCDRGDIVVPTRYDLDTDKWVLKEGTAVDYFYYSCPWNDSKYFIMQSCPWVSRTRERSEELVAEQMTIHGGMWFMRRSYFERLGGMSEQGYGGFAGEPLELCMKTWFNGGRVLVDKRTWYAHSRQGPAYSVSSTGMLKGLIWATKYWIKHPKFEWLINKFWPLPLRNTRVRGEKYYWPENWREYDRTM